MQDTNESREELNVKYISTLVFIAEYLSTSL